MRRLLLLLLFPQLLWAQGVRYDNYNMTSANNVPFGAQAPIFTLPNSTVTVCAYPDDGGQPCGNVIPIYSEPTLTQQADNPITADVHGRFGFWLAPGTYTYSVVTQGGQFAGTYIFTLGNGGAGDITFSTNGVNNQAQNYLDLDQGSGIVLTNTSGGHVLIDSITNFETQVTPPTTGQYVVIYPTTGTITSDPMGNSTIGPRGGQFNWSCSGLLCTISPTMTAHWSGFSLPSYVNPANVTSVYAFAVSNGTPLFGQMPFSGADVTQLYCTGMPGPSTATLFPLFGSQPQWTLQQVNSSTSLTGATIPTATCNLTLGASGSGASGISADIPAIGLIVYYTGTAPPADTSIKIAPPLCYNSSTLTLGDCAVLIAPLTLDASTSGNILTLTSSNTTSGYLQIKDTTASGNGWALSEWGSATPSPGSFSLFSFVTSHDTIRVKPDDSVIIAGSVSAPSFQETLTTPASSSATCTAGQFTDDANYHYVCTATNTWKRVALSSF